MKGTHEPGILRCKRSNEDIKQYQIRIDHAQLAEELKGTHLETEVIHSSAFIQYLNQQVDIMLKNLKQKDIDNLSIRISLDKIKLLSNSFSDKFLFTFSNNLSSFSTSGSSGKLI